MRRYRGSDKPPGPTLSPPPYNRRSASNASRTGGGSGSTRGGPSTRNDAHSTSGFSAAQHQDELQIRGSAAPPAFIDPRTKKPIFPPAGRSVPKLRMSDLTSSLAPLIDSQLLPAPPMPLMTEKRLSGGPRKQKLIQSKDMLASFDDAIRVPDMRAVNSKVAQLRKWSSHPGRDSNANNIGGGKGGKSGKMEEQNVRKLMGQLRDKYMEDMESQLGLAIERKPKSTLAESLMSAQDQSGGIAGVAIPRPSTNATEISSRIDKVVREWATESQKLNNYHQGKQKLLSSPQRSSQSGGTSQNTLNNNNKRPPPPQLQQHQQSPAATTNAAGQVAKRNNNMDSSTTTTTTRAPVEPASEKNKNIAKIANAFRKSLDPITKRDVRELINVTDEDVNKLDEEHEERMRAHESVFKNAVVSAAPSRNNNSVVGKREQGKSGGAQGRSQPSIPSLPEKKVGAANKPVEEPAATLNNKQPPIPINKKLIPFAEAIGLAGDDDNEVYKIIKEHMDYEMSSGPPKISSLSKVAGNKPSGTTTPSSKPNNNMVARGGDVASTAGKVVQKYGESHKKLQNLVDSFTLKVENNSKPRYGPVVVHATESTSSADEAPALPLSSLASQSTLNARRDNAAAAKATMSKSIKTIGRASSVAQRLGTLMSRVALRNEAYEFEKQQEAKEKSVSIQLDSPPGTPADQQNSIRRLSTPSSLVTQQQRPNPYEKNVERPNVPLGVSKIESKQFDKYVEEMKKVAQKAQESFDKFKERSEHPALGPFSDDDDDSRGDSESDQSSYAVAAAAAEIVAKQEEKRKVTQTRLATLQKSGGGGQQMMKPGQVSTSTQKFDAANSPRAVEIQNAIKSLKAPSTDQENNMLELKFTPGMSYTDQLMLKKLRKLKDQEGWGDLPSADEMDIPTEVPNQSALEALRKRTELEMSQQATERGSLGPVSLNAILRARMSK